MKLVIAPAARDDLKEIKSYISFKLHNPTAAVNVVSRIITSYKALKNMPEIGIPLDSKINVKTPFRFIISGNYLVFYKFRNDTVEIHRILYKGRNYIRILFPEEYNKITNDSAINET